MQILTDMVRKAGLSDDGVRPYVSNRQILESKASTIHAKNQEGEESQNKEDEGRHLRVDGMFEKPKMYFVFHW